jgi:hypothetical protein
VPLKNPENSLFRVFKGMTQQEPVQKSIMKYKIQKFERLRHGANRDERNDV